MPEQRSSKAYCQRLGHVVLCWLFGHEFSLGFCIHCGRRPDRG